MNKPKRKKVWYGWAGFGIKNILVCSPFTSYNSTCYGYTIFLNKKSARKNYSDVRKVKIMEVEK